MTGYKTHRRPRGHWEPCGCCVNGLTFMGDDCLTCGGPPGRVWVYPSGKIAQYPGGPFCG